MRSLWYVMVATALVGAPGCLMPGADGDSPPGSGTEAASADSALDVQDVALEGQLGNSTELAKSELDARLEHISDTDHFVRLDAQHDGRFAMVALTVRGGLDHHQWAEDRTFTFESSEEVPESERLYVNALGCSGTEGPNGPWSFDEWADGIEMQMIPADDSGHDRFEFELDFGDSNAVRGGFEVGNLQPGAVAP